MRNARFVYKSNGSESVLMLVCDTGYSADGTLQAMCSISGRRLYVQHPRSCMGILHCKKVLLLLRDRSQTSFYCSYSVLSAESTEWSDVDD